MKVITFLLLTILSVFSLEAQIFIERSLASSGGTILQSGTLSHTFSLGEAQIISLGSSNLEVHQGFQQGNLGPNTSNSPLIDANSWTIYPQPANQHLNVQLSDALSSPAYVQLYDIMGRSMLSSELMLPISQSSLQIDIGHWPAGNYFLQLLNNQGQLLFQSKWTKY